MKSIHSIFSAAALCIMTIGASTNSGKSATIASYDFTSDTSSSDSDANSTASLFTATGTAFGGSGRSTTGDSPNFFTRDGETSFSGSNYVGFTVNIDAGYELDLTAFTFDYEVQGSSFTTDFSVRTSADGFAAELLGTYSDNPHAAATFSTFSESASFDLSGASFQNLTGTFEIRIYGMLSSSAYANINRYDNALLTGDVALVPEPSALLLGGLGSLLLLRRRRTKH